MFFVTSCFKLKNLLLPYFLSDFHDFFTKCNVLLEKGHDNEEKGHGARERGNGAMPC